MRKQAQDMHFTMVRHAQPSKSYRHKTCRHAPFALRTPFIEGVCSLARSPPRRITAILLVTELSVPRHALAEALHGGERHAERAADRLRLHGTVLSQQLIDRCA